MTNYYCLVAGLPDLSPDDGKLSYSAAEFRETVYPRLSPKDRKLIDLLFLRYDNESLLALLQGKEVEQVSARGNYSAEELSGLIASVVEGDVWDKRYPSYFQTFIASYLKNKESGESFSVLPEDALSTSYYQYAMQTDNAFVAAWFEFNLDLNNLLTALTARKHKLEPASYIIGPTEVSEALRTSTARDFGLQGVFEPYEQVCRIAELPDLVEREKKTDQLKWEWLENASFFHYFSIEKLFVFLVKLFLIERWVSLDKEKGNEIFRRLIESLKNDVSIPEEFRK